MKRVHVMVSGEVQGVGFRYSMRHVAQRAQATGWVRNLRDGRVEAEVEGTDAAVDAVLAWARRGPAGSTVSRVEIDEIEPAGDETFEVRADA